MILICYLILQDHVSFVKETISVSHHLIKFGGLRHFASGNIRLCFSGWRAGDHILPLKPTITVCFCLKHMTWKHTTYLIQLWYGSVRPEKVTRRKKRREKGKAVLKLLAFHANATRTWWQLKRSRAKPPLVRWHPARVTEHKSCDCGNINSSNCQVTSCWSRDQRVICL